MFPNSVDPGKPVSDSKEVWLAAKRAAALPDHIVINSLRHTFASALAWDLRQDKLVVPLGS